MESDPERLGLVEQEWCGASLTEEDVKFLRELNFDVAPSRTSSQPSTPELPQKSYVVNPHQFVGHFLLPSGTRVVIRPKVDTSNIFRILAYIYAREHPDPFREAEVSYRPDQLLFEPLVELFNRLVAKRVRRGLYQNYQEHEENLLVFRGRLAAPLHIRQNLARPDHVFCRFTHNTHDVDDNQIIKWTLRFLLTVYPWSASTVQALRANFHQFEAVALKQVSRTAFANRHYHRLNEDYRLLHDFCRLFLEKASISEQYGRVRFRGYLLDMNQLFEQFVSNAFQVVGKTTRLLVVSQSSAYLSLYPVHIRPDITVRMGQRVVSIVDAKYKRRFETYDNPDVYQMLAYATALDCPRTFLIFPASECEEEGPVEIVNSPVTIEIRRLDIRDPNCVAAAERVAKDVLGGIGTPIEIGWKTDR